MVKKGEGQPEKAQKADLSYLLKPVDFGLPGRLSDVIRDFPSRAAAAEAAGVSIDQLGRYLRGASQPAFETVAKLSAARGFSLDWVWSGQGARKIGEDAAPEDRNAVSIPILDIRAGAAGFSEHYVIDEVPISSLALPRSFLVAHSIRPASARLVFCAGNSMEPTIHDTAPMIVDTSDLGERDDIYVMRRGHAVIVKRLQHMADGSLLLKSDNPAYEPERLPRDEADELMVIGRVGLVLQSI